MHSFVIASLFMLMVLAPCIVAHCSAYFPLRIKFRLHTATPARPRIKRIDPLLLATRKKPVQSAGLGGGQHIAPVVRLPRPPAPSAKAPIVRSQSN